MQRPTSNGRGVALGCSSRDDGGDAITTIPTAMHKSQLTAQNQTAIRTGHEAEEAKQEEADGVQHQRIISADAQPLAFLIGHINTSSTVRLAAIVISNIRLESHLQCCDPTEKTQPRSTKYFATCPKYQVRLHSVWKVGES